MDPPALQNVGPGPAPAAVPQGFPSEQNFQEPAFGGEFVVHPVNCLKPHFLLLAYQ